MEKGDLLDFRLNGGMRTQHFEGTDFSDKVRAYSIIFGFKASLVGSYCGEDIDLLDFRLDGGMCTQHFEGTDFSDQVLWKIGVLSPVALHLKYLIV